MEFNLEKGRQEKERGMSLSANARKEYLALAKELAKEIARKDPNKLCDADKVQRVLVTMKIDLGPAAGSLFKEKCWKFTGEWIPSKRVNQRTSMLRVWRLEE